MQKTIVNMNGRKRFLLLLSIMALVTAFVGAATLVTLYDAAFEEEKLRLVEMVQCQARLLESVARFDAQYGKSDVPGGPFEATLIQLRDAHSHFEGLGRAGEFTVARREKDQIVFLLTHRHHDLDKPHPVPFAGSEAEPMRRALQGYSGTVIGLDYRGKTVLAAYEPVAELDLGIVAKIDLAEIRSPFIRAGILAGVLGMILILAGTFLFFQIGFPLLRGFEESERKYSTLFHSSTEGVALLGDVFEDCNEQMCHILGCSRDDLIDHPPGRLSPAEQSNGRESEHAIEDILQAARAGLPQEFAWKVLGKDESLIDIEASVKAIEIKKQPKYLVIIRDITKRKRVEEQLRESERRFWTLVESAPIAVYETDVQGKCLFVNEKWRELAGMTLDDALGDGWQKGLHEQDRERISKLWAEHGQSREPWDMEYRFCAPDGRTSWIMGRVAALRDTDGRVTGYLGANVDITERIESERAIKESEEKYRAVFDHAVESIVLIDANTGRFLDFNSEAHTNLGYTREEFAELTVTDLEAMESSDEITAHIDKIRKRGFDKFETSHRTRDGQERHVLVSIKAVELKGRQMLLSLWHDVTEVKRAEIQIAKQHRFLQTVIDSLGHPLCVVNARDLTVRLANEACKAGDKSTGLHCYEIAHGRNKPCLGDDGPCPIKKVLATRKSATVCHSRIGKDGNRVHTQISAQPIFDAQNRILEVIEYSEDVTERKLAEEALMRSEEKFRTVIEQAGEAFYLINLDGEFVDVNHSACEAMGYSKEELLQLSVPDIDPVFPVDRFAELVHNLRHGQPMTIEAIHLRKDGSTFPVEIRASLVEVCGEKRILALARDITRRKNNEAMITASLEEKEVLLKEVHHRVKNNLQVISSLLRIQKDYTDDREIMSVLQASQSRVNSMALIHEQLYQSSNFADVDFPEYVQRLADRMMASYGVNSDQVSFENELRGIFVDIDSAVSLGLIVSELLSNALKHAFPDGKTGQVRISHNSEGNRCTLQISDTGVGMSSVMDLAHPKSMGLRLVNLLARQLGGSAKVEAGDGTTISVSYSQERV